MSLADRILAQHGADSVAAECVAFVGDNQTHAVVAAVLKEYFAEPLLRDGGPNQAIEYLGSTTAPSVLIVDVSEAASPQTAMLALGAALPDGTKVIGIGSVNDIAVRSEEHTSELQSLMRISYAVFCLKKKKHHTKATSLHSI